MKRQVVILLAIILGVGFFSQAVLAGGIDNKQNFSARYSATLNRNAALDGADIAAYNPAGITQGEDGLLLEVDVQGLFKVYENRYTSTFDGHVMKDQDNPSYVPALFSTFKKDNWGTFFTFTINGGGGDVDYETGNALTDSIEAGLGGQTLSNEYLKADSYYLTFTTGGTYQFNDIFSMAVGGRYIFAEKNVDAYGVANGPTGTIIGAYTEEADGYGYVASMNIAPVDSFLIALRYESAVELEFETEFENKTNASGTAILASLGKTDKGKYDRDLPAVFGAGVRWQAKDNLILESSFTLYFEDDADWDDAVSNVDNSYDVGISATYSMKENIRLSCGYMYTDVGIGVDDYSLTERISPVLDAHSFSIGFGYDFSEKTTLEIGAMYNLYDSGDGATTSGGVEYSKYNTGISAGLIFQF